MIRCSVCGQPVRYAKTLHDYRDKNIVLDLCWKCHEEYKYAEMISNNEEDDEVFGNSVELFCDELSEEEFTYYPYDKIYEMYCDFCEEECFEPKNKSIFTREVKKIYNLKSVLIRDKEKKEDIRFFVRRGK